MDSKVNWKEAMQFDTVSGEHHVLIDAKPPIGKGTGFTPKELVLAGIAGCTAMDVIALLRKYKQDVKSFSVESKATPSTDGHPVVFKDVSITFFLEGTIEPAKALEAVTLSQTQYCGVSAMISKTVPMNYIVNLNGETIGTGQAKFA
jgi:putative redox protein